MSKEISHEEYLQAFEGKEDKAVVYALEIRKFEIELYWKRATYFWAFIGSTFAAYIAVNAAATSPQQDDFSVVLSCLGFMFSVAWVFVNKGSKQWQENWENHVDMLEDKHVGPLYKIVLRRPKSKFLTKKFLVNILTGPNAYSVSKINQIISFYITILWFILIYRSLPDFSFSARINLFYVTMVTITFSTCILFYFLGRTNLKSHKHHATRRTPEIIMEKEK